MNFLKNHPSTDLSGRWSLILTDDDQEWTAPLDLESAGEPIIDAAVPGNLELDLQAAGQLDEPFMGMNMLKVCDLETKHAWYWSRFEAEEQEDRSAVLVFEGIDCFADIYLNGEKIGSTDNMLVEHTFDVTGMLNGQNELLVHIRPAELEAQTFEYSPGLNAGANNYSSLCVRKAPHMYGWDIMPRALSAGIWRPVRLYYRPQERIENVFLETCAISPQHDKAQLRLHYRTLIDLTAGRTYRLRLTGRCGDAVFRADQPVMFDAGHVMIDVDQPQLWWPAGRGAADLYDVEVILVSGDEVLDSVHFRHGIRTAVLQRTSTTTPAGDGDFCFVINGERVFSKGTNWVPLDAFHSRDAGRTQAALDLAEASGGNMIRCWGGNVYESDQFFDICDAKGIMVWQDFAMACAIYPQDREFQAVIDSEARKVVRRLRQHASLVLWAGDNECDIAYGWFHRGDPNRNVLTREVLPRVLQEEDPTRPFLPSSPFVDAQAFAAGEGHTRLPENHLWGPRNYYKSEFYTTAACHFVSEIGYHGCPAPASLARFLTPEKIWPFKKNEEWDLHCTNPVPGISDMSYRVPLMATQVKELFGSVPETLKDFAFASQAAQAEAKKYFIEWFRAGKWRRTGILWWNLLDGWPQLSDAVVDYYFRKKLAFEYIRTAQKPLLLILNEPDGKQQGLVVSNDTRDDIELTFSVRDIESGETAAEGRGLAKADAVTALTEISYDKKKKKLYVLEWQAGTLSGTSHYLAGKAPFDLAVYRGWISKAGLLADEAYAWIRQDRA